jgi:hypothetical protein
MLRPVTILGCGFTGRALARLALAQGRAVRATVRDPAHLPALEALGITARAAPQLDADTLAGWVDGAGLAVCFPPDGHTDARIAPLLRGATGIAYVSSTGVYGDRRGHIDHHTPAEPADAKGARAPRRRVAVPRRRGARAARRGHLRPRTRPASPAAARRLPRPRRPAQGRLSRPRRRPRRAVPRGPRRPAARRRRGLACRGRGAHGAGRSHRSAVRVDGPPSPAHGPCRGGAPRRSDTTAPSTAARPSPRTA